ncbi:beta-ketoacyl synthase N-terminal-like domain-containing protein [Streptomyces virginiae]|uniref:beta-ketoacyl synthase N-terminal-like domain-containing protein n=1 Tax=Streptomyces virginiae TaxID=1961 RepID=UPI003684B43E
MTTAVVTGTGVVAPNGLGTEEFWSATLRGRPAITPIDGYDTTAFPSRLAGQVRDFDAAGRLPSRLVPRTDRMTRFALAAAGWALADAALGDVLDEIRPARDAHVVAGRAQRPGERDLDVQVGLGGEGREQDPHHSSPHPFAPKRGGRPSQPDRRRLDARSGTGARPSRVRRPGGHGRGPSPPG